MRVSVVRAPAASRRGRALVPLLATLLLLATAASAAIPLPSGVLTPAADGGYAWSNANSPAGGSGWGIGGSSSVLVVSTLGAGTLQSHDGGLSWSAIPGFPIEEAQDIVADPNDPDTVYVAGFGGLARTTDGGATWEHPRSDSRTTVATVSPSGLLAASGRDGHWSDAKILVSSDRGDTWTDWNAPIASASLYGIAFGLDDDNLVVVSISRTWVTTDGGATWSEENQGALYLTRSIDGTVWRGGMGPLEQSADGGVTWQAASGVTWVRGLAPRNDGGIFAATNDAFVFTTGPSSEWTIMGQGELAFALTGMLNDPSDANAILMSHEGLGVIRLGPDGAGGYRMESRTNGFPPVDLYSLGASGDGSLLLAGSPLGLYASRDDGATWSHTGAGYGFLGVRATTANHDGSIIYAGGQNMFFWPFLMYSQDGGATWDYANININGDGRVVALVAHPDEAETAYAVVWGELAQSRVFRTTNGGSTWESILTSEARLNDGAWHTASGSLFVATDTGVLAFSHNSGAWSPATLTPGQAQTVAGNRDVTYAGGTGTNLLRTLPGLPILAPWSSAIGTQVIAAHPDDLLVFAIRSGNQLDACDGGLLPGACTSAAPPAGGFRDVLVTPDGSQVLVATTGAGLWAAPLGGA